MSRSLLVVLGALALPALAHAALPALDGRYPPCAKLNNVRDTSTGSEAAIRSAGAGACAAQYRLEHGLLSLPSGSVFKITWPDGSSERMIVTDPLMSAGTQPLPGTQRGPARPPGRASDQ
jgi:hypothetical protein